jgi:hypothetical protein
MPRRSKADLSVAVPQAPAPIGVRPPTTLSEPARRVFEELVASTDHAHFVPSDVPLLAQYAEAITLAERSAAELQGSSGDPKALALWEKATRAMTALSMRLRLSPQARREKALAEPRRLDWSTRFGIEQQYRDDR